MQEEKQIILENYFTTLMVRRMKYDLFKQKNKETVGVSAYM